MFEILKRERRMVLEDFPFFNSDSTSITCRTISVKKNIKENFTLEDDLLLLLGNRVECGRHEAGAKTFPILPA